MTAKATPRSRSWLGIVFACVASMPVLAANPSSDALTKALPPAPMPSIDAFMQIGSTATPELTDDGETLLFLSAASGTNQIYRRTSAGWPLQLTFFPDGMSWTSYTADLRYAIVGASHEGNENDQMYLLDTSDGTIRPLTEKPDVRHQGVVWARDQLRIYYSANAGDPKSFWIYELDLTNGANRVVLEAPGVNVAADVSHDGTRLVYAHAESSLNSDLFLLDLRTGETKILTPHDGDQSFSGGVFEPDDRSILFASDENPEGQTRLGTLDLATLKREFLPGQDPRWEVESFAVSRSGRYLAIVTNEEGYSRLHLTDRETRRDLPVPALDGVITSPVLGDAGCLAFGFSNSTHPQDVWLWDFREGKGKSGETLTQLTFSPTAGVDLSRFQDPVFVKYKSFDGTEIPAFLYLPLNTQPGSPIPFILDVHGGPASQSRPDFNRHFQYLLENGFGLFVPNFRGSSGYGRSFEDADNYKSRLDAVKDVAAGAEWLIAQGFTRKGAIGIKGGSYGGYMTLACMTEYPDLFAAGCDQVGISNFVTFLEGTAGYRRALRETEYGPLTDRGFLESISPLHKADRIRGALLVVHGTNDPRVPIGEARQILRAVAANGVPVDSLVFSDEGHSVGKRDNRLVLYRRMVEFFILHLGRRV